MSAFGVLREEERRRMNKFAPPTGDENVAPGTLPAEQTGAAQPVPGPNAAWNQGSGVPRSQPWALAPVPVAQPGVQMARSSYGTFYAVTDKGRGTLRCWLIWGIGLACAALFMWLGIEGKSWLYTAAAIIGAVVCLLLGVTEARWERWLVRVMSGPDGTILVRPGATVTYLRILTALLASAAGVCFFYVSLFSVNTDLRNIASGNELLAAAVALYLVAKIIGSQSRECIIVSQQRVDIWGKGGIHYSIPWSDQPRVIGQRNNGKSLLIGAGQNIECPVVFTTLRIRPSRVRSLLAYYQTTPGALDRLSAPEARDEAAKALS